LVTASAAWLLIACGATPPGTDAPPPPPPPPAEPTTTPSAAAEAKPVESEAERAKRIAAAKREHCQRLAQAAQSRGQDVLLNVHNGATLIAMGGELDESADLVDRVRIDAGELGSLAKLRDRYTSTTRAMARALFVTADAASFEQRKEPLAEFRELEPKLRALLAELTEHCSS
jgi:hypothetical protein